MQYGVGIYGYGFIGKVHAYCYQNMPFFYEPPALETKLIGVCTSRQETVEKARKESGFAFATTDYRDLLENDEIQIVHCCTPNYLHHDFLIEAIKARKHIYCEKPLAMGFAEAKSILETAKKVNYDKKFQITHNYRYLPATLRAKQLIDSDFMGKIFGFRAQYLHSGYIDSERPMSWRLDNEKAGSGALGDLGTHVLDLIYHLLGSYRKVMADQETFIKTRYDQYEEKYKEVKVDDITTALVRMDDGAMGTIEAWRLATGSEDELRFEIHGSKGGIRFNLMEPNYLEVYDNTESTQPLGGNKGWKQISTMQKYPEPAGFPSQKSPIGWIRSHQECLHSFLQTIKNDTETSPDLKDGVYIEKIHDAIIKSAHQGSWQNLHDLQ